MVPGHDASSTWEELMASELEGSRCPGCGLVAVPPEPIGCERCGTPVAALQPTTISSAGVVTGHAVVHEHARPEPPTPFVVVEVLLDDGPVVRSLLRGAGPGDVALGDRVDGELIDGRFAFVAVTGGA
jgi:uncharacterized OB-fold protein